MEDQGSCFIAFIGWDRSNITSELLNAIYTTSLDNYVFRAIFVFRFYRSNVTRDQMSNG